jgi:hypothetical protein
MNMPPITGAGPAPKAFQAPQIPWHNRSARASQLSCGLYRREQIRMRVLIAFASLALAGCVASNDAQIQDAACDAAYRAVVPSPLPSDEELAAKGPEYANAFIERVGEAGRRLTDCYQRAFLIEERQDAATAAGLDALRDAGASLGATGASMLSQPTPTLAAPPEPPPGIVPPNADQMMSQARKPQPPPWCRPDSPYSNTTACPPP